MRLTITLFAFLLGCVYTASVEKRQPIGDFCPLVCTSEPYDPVCGTDGVTYSKWFCRCCLTDTRCDFHKAHCKNPHLLIDHVGPCKA